MNNMQYLHIFVIIKGKISMTEIVEINKLKEYNPLVLAFLGDAVHTQFVREHIVLSHTYSAGAMHKESAKFCSAIAQSKTFDKIVETLTELEKEFAMRARNAKNSHVAKNASLIDYKKATAYEALIGFLYLSGQFERMRHFLEISMEQN